jgi:hypothetical protein
MAFSRTPSATDSPRASMGASSSNVIICCRSVFWDMLTGPFFADMITTVNDRRKKEKRQNDGALFSKRFSGNRYT